MGTRIQIRRDTSTNWSINNPVLSIGEPGLETDTQIVKYGDGVTAWNNLPYSNLNSLADFTTADLVENTANLYYTNARVYSNVLNLNIFATNNQLSLYATNSQLGLYATNSQLASYATNAQLGSYATNAQLALYATNAQVGSFATNSQLALYTTNAQAADFATIANINLKANTSDLTTANVSEVNNLYYSNARVTQYLSSNSIQTFGNVVVLPSFDYDNLPTTHVTSFGLRGAIVFETSNNVFRGWTGSTWTILG